MRPRRTSPLVALVAWASLATLAVACASDEGPGGDRAVATPAGNAAQAALLPTNAIELPSFDLATYRELLGQLRGTPVVVNVWASWCGPCESEATHLAVAHRRYGDRVQFLGVDILDARDDAVEFMRRHAVTYPSVFDPTAEIRDGLGLVGQPVTLFYEASGELASTWIGEIDRETLTERIEDIARTA